LDLLLNEMSEIKKFIIENLSVSVIIATCMLVIAFFSFLLNKRKSKFDRADFKSKQPNFSIYLENSYKFKKNKNSNKFLMINVLIKNLSSTKNSLSPKLKIVYFSEDGKKDMDIMYDENCFDNQLHVNLTKFPKHIRIDEKEIKSGWLIFTIPNYFKEKRIDYYEISLEDGLGNKVSIICNLIKEIDYENNNH